jgi:hypothetical protein
MTPIHDIDEVDSSEARQVTPARKPRSSVGAMGGLFIVQLNGAQVQVLDDSPKTKACVICALGAVVAQGWCGAVQNTQNTNDASATTAASPSSSCEDAEAVSSEFMLSSSALPSQPLGGIAAAGCVSEGETLQRLVRRELPHFVETVNVQVRSLSVFSAPSDLDDTLLRRTHRWLPKGWAARTADASSFGRRRGAGSSSSNIGPEAEMSRLTSVHDLGVYRCILAPVAVLEANVSVEHAAVPIHAIRVSVPNLHADCDSEYFRRLVAVVSSLTEKPLNPSRAKDRVVGDVDFAQATPEAKAAAALFLDQEQQQREQKQQQQQRQQQADVSVVGGGCDCDGDAPFSCSSTDAPAAGIDRGGSGGDEGGINSSAGTVLEEWRRKQASQWEFHRLVSLLGSLQLLEQSVSVGSTDLARIMGGGSSGGGGGGSVGGGVNLQAWINTVSQSLLVAVAHREAAKTSLAALVRSTKTQIQVQPHMHCTWLVGGVSVELLSPAQQPLASFHLERISGIFTNVRRGMRSCCFRSFIGLHCIFVRVVAVVTLVCFFCFCFSNNSSWTGVAPLSWTCSNLRRTSLVPEKEAV